jgi:hypothetical protein
MFAYCADDISHCAAAPVLLPLFSPPPLLPQKITYTHSEGLSGMLGALEVCLMTCVMFVPIMLLISLVLLPPQLLHHAPPSQKNTHAVRRGVGCWVRWRFCSDDLSPCLSPSARSQHSVLTMLPVLPPSPPPPIPSHTQTHIHAQ